MHYYYNCSFNASSFLGNPQVFVTSVTELLRRRSLGWPRFPGIPPSRRYNLRCLHAWEMLPVSAHTFVSDSVAHSPARSVEPRFTRFRPSTVAWHSATAP